MNGRMDNLENIHMSIKPSNKLHLEPGSALIETALTIALMSMVALVALRDMGEKVSQKLDTVQQNIGDSVPGGCRGGPNPEECHESNL